MTHKYRVYEYLTDKVSFRDEPPAKYDRAKIDKYIQYNGIARLGVHDISLELASQRGDDTFRGVRKVYLKTWFNV